MRQRRTTSPYLAECSRPDVNPILVDEPTAAAMLSVSPRTLWAMEKTGAISARRISQDGRRKLYHIDDLRRYADQLPLYTSPDRNSQKEIDE